MFVVCDYYMVHKQIGVTVYSCKAFKKDYWKND